MMRDPKGDDGRLRQFPNYQKKMEEYIKAERCNSYHYTRCQAYTTKVSYAGLM